MRDSAVLSAVSYNECNGLGNFNLRYFEVAI